jgi:predicted aspartyl protease
VYIRHFYDEQNAVDGYLGIAAISRLVASVDYGTDRLTLTRPRDADPTATRAPTADIETQKPGANVSVRTTASGFLSGEVNIAGITKPLNFIIDTGATVTVLSAKAAAIDEAQPFIRQGKMKVYGAAGVEDNVRIATLPRVGIGACSREWIDAAVLDLEPVNETAGFQQSGILGGNFLRHYRVIFDFPRSVVRFESLDSDANSKTGPTPENQDR